MRRALAACLALAVATPLGAQEPVPSDPEVVRGIAQVEEGDYDAAILTLDTAARRLAGEKGRSRELSQAYLYLGVAYVGKGHEAAAKAKFREAVLQLRDMTLSPEKFPPKVIDLFEAAREEASRTPAAPPASPPPPRKKGGSKGLLIAAGVAAAGGGVAAALGGGGGGGGGSGTTVDVFNGSLSPGQDNVDRFFGPAQAAGPWQATLTWSNTESFVFVEVYDVPGTNFIIRAERQGQTQVGTSWSGAANATYKLFIYYDAEGAPAPGTFELRVQRPR